MLRMTSGDRSPLRNHTLPVNLSLFWKNTVMSPSIVGDPALKATTSRPSLRHRVRKRWGRVVVVATFALYFVLYGVLFSYNLLFVAFQEEFKSSATLTGIACAWFVSRFLKIYVVAKVLHLIFCYDHPPPPPHAHTHLLFLSLGLCLSVCKSVPFPLLSLSLSAQCSWYIAEKHIAPEIAVIVWDDCAGGGGWIGTGGCPPLLPPIILKFPRNRAPDTSYFSDTR